MKTETFFWIIGISFGILTLIGWILHLDEKSNIKKKIGKIIFSISWRMTLLPIIIALLISNERDYDLNVAQEFWTDFHLAQIDSMMHLTNFNKHFVMYSSLSKSQIRHDTKFMKFDLFDIYKNKDSFVNEIESKELIIEFTKPNFHRDSLRVITIKDTSRAKHSNIDTLTNFQCDSVLIAWGLSNIYNKN